MAKNIRYWDVDSKKTAWHAVFDEAHYTADHCSLMAQLSYDLGYESSYGTSCPTPTAVSAPVVVYPLSSDACPTACSPTALALPLLERLAPSPPTAAAAAVAKASPWLSKSADEPWQPYDVAQIEFLLNPFNKEFVEHFQLRGSYPTASLVLQEEDGGHLCLDECAAGTAAGCIPKWRTRLRGCYLRAVDGKMMQTVEDVRTALGCIAVNNLSSCVSLTFAACDVPYGVTSEGVPQLHMDQWTHI